MLINSDAYNDLAKRRANGGIPQTYANFDLMIHRAGDKYSARVINSLAGEPSAEFVLPVAVATLQKLFADLDQAAKKDGAACASAKIAMRNFGGRLFEAVFEDALRGCLQSSLDEANQKGWGTPPPPSSCRCAGAGGFAVGAALQFFAEPVSCAFR